MFYRLSKPHKSLRPQCLFLLYNNQFKYHTIELMRSQKILLFLLTSFSFFFTCLNAQDFDVSKYKEQYQLHIKKATGTIKIDGELSDADWELAEAASDFWLKFPRDDVKARKRTVVKLTYDDKFLYASAIVSDSSPFIGQSLKRDSRVRENDGVALVIDPAGNKTNGFIFSVTAFNVQADEQFGSNPGDLNYSWDNKWYSETKRFADHYTVEMAIPFKVLRYDKDKTIWGINFIASNQKLNEFYAWTRVPVNFPGVDLGYTGALIWDKAPPKPGSNISVVPYMTGSAASNKEDGLKTKGDFDAGFDAKVALNSSLNLDLTVNPDFSQIEVDRQVTNISRFSIFFPERRNFFLENNDLFSDYGIPPVRPFYSRRIGLDPDGNPIPIIGGARLSGNIAPKTRLGLLTMQTKATDNYASQNYSALTFQQQLLKRSAFKAYIFNRQGFEDNKHSLQNPLDKYGRNAGGEFSFNNEKGNWQGWLGYHLSMKEKVKNNKTFLNFGGGYFGKRFTSLLDFDGVGENYYTDMGFVQRIENYDALKDTIFRLGFKQLFNENAWNIYPDKGKINRHTIRLENFLVINPDKTINETTHELSYSIEMKNTSSFDIGYSYAKTNLLYHTGFTDGDPLPPGKYTYNQFNVSYESDKRKKIAIETGVTTGKYFTADYQQFEAAVIFRSQPWLTVELNAEYNKLNFPDPYGKENLFLLASRVEINFSTKMFWTTFLQYNTQRNNFNINSRFQWRYKAASDFFLVYTDNYYSDPFLKNKNRALVFKLNYWLNL